MKILNLSNINDSAIDQNYRTIFKLSPETTIMSSPHDYNIVSPTDVFLSYCYEEDLDLIVGNGFGAFLGYTLGAELGVRTLLTNPYIPAHTFIIPELHQYEQELKELWEKYQGKNVDCHILLSIAEHTPDANKVMTLLKDTADIKLVCTNTSVFNTSSYESWLKSYL